MRSCAHGESVQSQFHMSVHTVIYGAAQLARWQRWCMSIIMFLLAPVLFCIGNTNPKLSFPERPHSRWLRTIDDVTNNNNSPAPCASCIHMRATQNRHNWAYLSHSYTGLASIAIFSLQVAEDIFRKAIFLVAFENRVFNICCVVFNRRQSRAARCTNSR